jgi:hypothetical protein
MIDRRTLLGGLLAPAMPASPLAFPLAMPTDPRAAGIRRALATWRAAAADCRRHFDGPDCRSPGADGPDGTNDRVYARGSDAAGRLIDLVLDACEPSDSDTVAIDLGHCLVVWGPHHEDALNTEPEEGGVLMVLPKQAIIRA